MQVVIAERKPELHVKASLGVVDERLSTVEKRFASMTSTTIRRRLLQREQDSDIEKKIDEMITKLSGVTGNIPEMGRKQQLYTVTCTKIFLMKYWFAPNQ